MITAADFAILSAPFAERDHEFKNGFIYLTEEAVCNRIETVDLSWEWRVTSVARLDPKLMIATSVGHLTICGVTRSGEGSQMAEYRKGTDIESGEIEKGSETDALKRAARKFGIGRYLLQCPKDVKEYGVALNRWLDSLKRTPAPTSTSDHWSTDAAIMSRMYGWAWANHEVNAEGVNAAIAAAKRPITSMSGDEVKTLIAEYAGKVK